ncbi:MAG: histidine kinase dimerization/phosphoacceptor domain -containing protein [Spirochaetales bacterium]|uniref:histidine kinase n=1 Tax=Candidatus Thalassospirochaeta sargassi TaxID=3119039 RepID=A0AAJ1MKN9_9SPIO|nr:histidine kinase dimerization/phosphoacceptor domain -containing protein [Spirochaetales bacterium]
MTYRGKLIAVFLPMIIIPLIAFMFIIIGLTCSELVDYKKSVMEFTGITLTGSINSESENLMRDNLFDFFYFRTRMYERAAETLINLEQDIVVIITDDDRIFSSSDYFEELLSGQKQFAALVKEFAAKGGVRSIFLPKNGDSSEYLVYAEHSEIGECYNVILSPIDLVRRPLYKVFVGIVPIILIFILAVVAAALAVSRSFTTPLTKLAMGVDEICSKKYDAVIDYRSGSVEFRKLADNFNSMAANLREEMNQRESFENELKGSIAEKEILLKELNHRVKNNMQIISSLLELQSNSACCKENAADYRTAISRINTMALVHEKLYQSNDFTSLELSSRYNQKLWMGVKKEQILL